MSLGGLSHLQSLKLFQPRVTAEGFRRFATAARTTTGAVSTSQGGHGGGKVGGAASSGTAGGGAEIAAAAGGDGCGSKGIDAAAAGGSGGSRLEIAAAAAAATITSTTSTTAGGGNGGGCRVNQLTIFGAGWMKSIDCLGESVWGWGWVGWMGRGSGWGGGGAGDIGERGWGGGYMDGLHALCPSDHRYSLTWSEALGLQPKQVRGPHLFTWVVDIVVCLIEPGHGHTHPTTQQTLGGQRVSS